MLVRQRHWLLLGRRQLVYWGEPWPPFQLKQLLAIAIALLPSAVLAEQFTPQQMLDVMTKSPDNRDVRVQDATLQTSNINSGFIDIAAQGPPD